MTDYLKCPDCDTRMELFLFMGVQPEGYTCPKCKMFYPIDDNGLPIPKTKIKVY
jgi:uncharacterized protein YbaR (Trm112 family)